MVKVLVIKSSLMGEDGSSSQLANEFTRLWKEKNEGDTFLERNLGSEPVPHLDMQTFSSFLVAPADRSEEQTAAVALSDILTEEFMSADVVVFGVPMYNLGIPSPLKAYFDHIARAGISFKYTEAGPVGLAGDKRVYVLASRGGFYTNSNADIQTTYMNAMLNFLGVEKINYVVAEGLNISPEQKEKSMKQAMEEVNAIF